MAECDFTLTADEQGGPCKFRLVASNGPAPIDCTKTQPWSPDPIVIPRDCYLSGLSDADAADYTFTVTNTIPAGTTISFDAAGNMTYTPAPSTEPPACGSSMTTVQVNADNGEN